MIAGELVLIVALPLKLTHKFHHTELYEREQRDLSVRIRGQLQIPDEAVFEFADKIVADKKRAAAVVEKALEMKLVALVVANELEKEKGEKADSKYAADAEKLFAQLLDGKYSDATKKTVYQLRLQTLLEAHKQGDAAATAKLEDVVERLKKETDAELQNLAVSVKGQLLIDAAQKDEAAVAALDKFADETLALAQEKPEMKTQASYCLTQ
jgi:hypothetical protein